MRKDWILISIIGLILVIGLGLIGYLKLSKKEVAANPLESSQNQEVAGEQASSIDYFADDAKVMYFYSDFCHWCQEEKKVLEELGKEGYKVKSMDVGEKPEFGQQYNISGTPTFVAENGERLVGFQTIGQLKPWLEQHK